MATNQPSAAQQSEASCSLNFVVNDVEAAVTRLKDERLPSGGYIAISANKSGAESAEGTFKGFQDGDVEAHTAIELSLYMSFDFTLDISSAQSAEDFTRDLNYFYIIVSDPSHKRMQKGCVTGPIDERIKNRGNSLWYPGKSRNSHQEEMSEDGKVWIKFDGYQDGILEGHCFDLSDGIPYKGGHCDCRVSFRLKLVDATKAAPPPAAGSPLRTSGPARTPILPTGQAYDPHDAPTIQGFHPAHRGGDFAGDLTPAGIDAFQPGGNLMGPNHPAFAGGSGLGVGGGGLGMQPRYDPIGPPGGPQDVQPADGKRRPPGGFGDPNPDHQRPPDDLNNNMFL